MKKILLMAFVMAGFVLQSTAQKKRDPPPPPPKVSVVKFKPPVIVKDKEVRPAPPKVDTAGQRKKNAAKKP